MTEPLVAEVETTLASGNGHTDPAQVRPRLAEAAAASLDDISTALLDAALGATREMWVTTACSGCGKKQRVEVKIPDVRVEGRCDRASASRGLGDRLRPMKRRAPASRARQKPSKLGWGDMKMIFATQFASEIAAVTRGRRRPAARAGRRTRRGSATAPSRGARIPPRARSR